jgi:hypothetical protein
MRSGSNDTPVATMLAWSAMTSGSSGDLSSVRGISGSDVFAVGSYSLILHYASP